MVTKVKMHLLILFSLIVIAHSCTNVLVTNGASMDNSTMIAYNADSSTLYGSIYHYPAQDNTELGLRDVWDWDSGRYLGQI